MAENNDTIQQDVLLRTMAERRLLSAVPDPEGIRHGADRRFTPEGEEFDPKNTGTRYISEFPVELYCMGSTHNLHANAYCVNISVTGMLLRFDDNIVEWIAEHAKKVKLKFKIPAGAMPEGLEMKVKIDASLARVDRGENTTCAYRFQQNLLDFTRSRKDRYALLFSSVLLFVVVAFIVLMRTGSVIYLKYSRTHLHMYSIVAAVFLLSRYFFGALYRTKKVDSNYTPGVTIIIPCFNEEEWIQRTIVSCMNQDYPVDKLEVIAVDDCSTDQSVAKIKEIVERLHEEDPRFYTRERLSYIVQEVNQGKRNALARGALLAKHDLVVFVDSDSFLDSSAIRNLVQPFKDPKMGGVSGRCDVANTYTNALTKMQAVRYYVAFRIMKAAEAYFDAVTCLSGPLSCYRKSIVLRNREKWINQKFFGRRATFGDDRAMTNFVLRHHRTSYQDSAICSTVVPNKYKSFLRQQMRWKRSWLRESLLAARFIWLKEPFAALFFYMGLVVPILGPVIVLYNFLYVPITQSIFPVTFLMGLFLMAALMSVVQLLFKKSTIWLYGFYFVLFYELVLLWQMPVALVTFWKSTWGTRMTPEDVAANARKNKRKLKRRGQPEMSA